MKDILKTLFNWVASRACITSCFYFGITYHNGLAGLGQVFMWGIAGLGLIATLLYCGDSAEARQRRQEFIAKHGNTWRVPRWISLIHTLALAAFLAWHFYVFTALAGLLTHVLGVMVADKFKETSADSDNGQPV